MSFNGRPSVLRSLRKHRRTGKVTSATLHVRTAGTDDFADVVYTNAYLAPVGSVTGLGGDGFPSQTTTLYLWQVGESTAPKVDNKATISGNTWLIVAITTRLNADSGYALHDCTVTDHV